MGDGGNIGTMGYWDGHFSQHESQVKKRHVPVMTIFTISQHFRPSITISHHVCRVFPPLFLSFVVFCSPVLSICIFSSRTSYNYKWLNCGLWFNYGLNYGVCFFFPFVPSPFSEELIQLATHLRSKR